MCTVYVWYGMLVITLSLNNSLIVKYNLSSIKKFLIEVILLQIRKIFVSNLQSGNTCFGFLESKHEIPASRFIY